MCSPHGGDRRVPGFGPASGFGSAFDFGFDPASGFGSGPSSAPLGAAFLAPDDRLARDVSRPEPSEAPRWNA